VSERRSVIVGTAGHVDHGKSSLVTALTGVDPDRLVEEKRRGLTIELGFAPMRSGGGSDIGIVDVPGHEDFMRTMLAGASGIDLLLLVVAADEGPMPQTREHLDVADLLGIDRGVVALSMIDRVDREWFELAADSVREELERLGAAYRWPIVPVSAHTGEGIEALRRAIETVAMEVPTRDSGDMFRLPVDRAFSIAGAGTVVTGSVWSGGLRRGDEVRLLPSGERARVRAIQEFGVARESIGAGARCALALSGLPLERTGRGDTVVTDSSWEPVRRFGARIRVLADVADRLKHTDTVRLYHGTSEVLARVLLSSNASLGPGESEPAVLVTRSRIPLRTGDRFVLRGVARPRTLAGGIVADTEPDRRWRAHTGAWDRVLDGRPEEALQAVLELAAGRGVDPSRLPLRTGVPPALIPEGSGAIQVMGRLYSASVVDTAREAALTLVEQGHRDSPRLPGIPIESVRARLSVRLNPSLADHVLRALESDGSLVRAGPEIRLRDHSVRLTEVESKARDRIMEIIEEHGLTPPDPDRLAALGGVERGVLNDLLRLLVREGRLVAVGPDLHLSASAIERLKAGASAVLERSRPASPAAFASELGLSRRELIPLLEYLDEIGVTQRTGSGRVAGATAGHQST
jgi:selenocysteine-specific elongation factor